MKKKDVYFNNLCLLFTSFVFIGLFIPSSQFICQSATLTSSVIKNRLSWSGSSSWTAAENKTEEEKRNRRPFITSTPPCLCSPCPSAIVSWPTCIPHPMNPPWPDKILSIDTEHRIVINRNWDETRNRFSLHKDNQDKTHSNSVEPDAHPIDNLSSIYSCPCSSKGTSLPSCVGVRERCQRLVQ